MLLQKISFFVLVEPTNFFLNVELTTLCRHLIDVCSDAPDVVAGGIYVDASNRQNRVGKNVYFSDGVPEKGLTNLFVMACLDIDTTT